ncbi:hypothetical protein BD626DRAFT_568527 [Schizophyllum amplum]|uniref:Uncharacterized protein n=1 Tax=Schizophyllum amplum TaxID=97359 RepID=A0A550CGI5_9AGAR|nr:hypothetical protein BD626DRAFT_568527 [Auriculariopsis ampla]
MRASIVSLLSLILLSHLFVRIAHRLLLDALILVVFPSTGPSVTHLDASTLPRRRSFTLHRILAKMCNATELWLTYQLASRTHLPPTTQLIDLALTAHKMHDLEDVLEHVFREGYIEPKYRSNTYWERADGTPVKASQSIEEVINAGVGMCAETALKLVVDDAPTALWFRYHYLHPAGAKSVTQRVRLSDVPHLRRLAHVTNFVFAEGFLPASLRPFVHWQGICGRRIEEHAAVEDLLKWGEGLSEEKAMQLVVDNRAAACCVPESPKHHTAPAIKPAHCHCAHGHC